MRAVLCIAALLLSCLARSDIWDRTLDPNPLVVAQDTDWSDVTLVDNNAARPAVVLIKGTLRLGACYRQPKGVNDLDGDPGLGKWFDGAFLPKLGISFSHHDFARAFVAAMGTFRFECPAMVADTCLSVTAAPDGTYGQGSVVKLGQVSGYRFAVLATGQQGLSISIDKATAALWNTGPAGHTVYLNQSTLISTGEYLRVKGAKVRIGKATALAMVPGVSLDNVTFKSKGGWEIDYECLDDANPCGALDQYGSSGTARVNWVCPQSDAKNPVFTAFRLGGDGGFGTPNGKFLLTGSFDASKCVDQTVPVCRVETAWAAFGVCKTIGGGVGSFYPGTDQRGLSKTQSVIEGI